VESGIEPATAIHTHPRSLKEAYANSTIRNFSAVFCCQLADSRISSREVGQSQVHRRSQRNKLSNPPNLLQVRSRPSGGGTSFTLDTGQNTLDFVVDKNTQVKGQVKQGTAVTVEYQAMANGQLLAVNIMAQLTALKLSGREGADLMG
jgi:hypothetical protein